MTVPTSEVIADLATANLELRNQLAKNEEQSVSLEAKINELNRRIVDLTNTSILVVDIAAMVKQKLLNGHIPLPQEVARHNLPVKITVPPEDVKIFAHHSSIFVKAVFEVKNSSYSLDFELLPGFYALSEGKKEFYPDFVLQYQKPVLKRKRVAKKT